LRALIKKLFHNFFIESLRLSTELAARKPFQATILAKIHDFPKIAKNAFFGKKRDIALPMGL
jgi:hypothetical protein